VCLKRQFSSATPHTPSVLATSGDFTASAHYSAGALTSFVCAFGGLATTSHGLFAHSFSTSHIIYL
jgi:hypothetical protein